MRSQHRCGIEIPEAAAELSGDPQIRVVVMRGVGETAFVSGADISEFESTRTGSAAQEYDERAIRAPFRPWLGSRSP